MTAVICSVFPATESGTLDMMGALLWRGMLLGVLAGLLCFGFLKLVGEAPIEAAIAFEEQHGKAEAPAGAHVHAAPAAASAEPHTHDLVSRETQAGPGLLVAVTVYGAAFGGLFAVAFALAYGRMAELSPRATAAVLAALGFVAVYLMPLLKYPPNPPAAGAGETIGLRTALYFSMIALSLAAMIGAGMLRLRLQPRLGGWNAGLAAAGAYLVVIAGIGAVLPAFNDVPEHFPAATLWDFRLATLGAQLLLYAVVGIGFGFLAERVLASARFPLGTMPRPRQRIAP
jgi:hypothetical protein